jgi:hypothetical protein
VEIVGKNHGDFSPKEKQATKSVAPKEINVGQRKWS